MTKRQLKPKPPTQPPPREGIAFKASKSVDLLRRLGRDPERLLTAKADQASEMEQRFNAAVGCKTSEVALHLLGQVIRLQHPNIETASDDQVDGALMTATALLAELQPETATETMLAVQMVGVHKTALTFMHRATVDGQTAEGADRNVLRVTRLMRLFTEQIDAMAKLKGKSGQQRVTVEHVTVGAGGQAIVGAIMPGGRGTAADDPR